MGAFLAFMRFFNLIFGMLEAVSEAEIAGRNETNIKRLFKPSRDPSTNGVFYPRSFSTKVLGVMVFFLPVHP